MRQGTERTMRTPIMVRRGFIALNELCPFLHGRGDLSIRGIARNTENMRKVPMRMLGRCHRRRQENLQGDRNHGKEPGDMPNDAVHARYISTTYRNTISVLSQADIIYGLTAPRHSWSETSAL